MHDGHDQKEGIVNQGKVENGQAIDEQLMKIGIKPSDLDYVLLSHLDCDHVNGLELVKDAKHILVSKDELVGSKNLLSGLESKA